MNSEMPVKSYAQIKICFRNTQFDRNPKKIISKIKE